MLFVKLEKQYYDLFGDLDPFSMLDGAGQAGSFAMGLWGRYEGYDYPVGLAICKETEDALIINWMMVYSIARGQGVGAYMIQKLIQLSKDAHITKIQALFPYSPARDILCRGEKVYFKQYGFVKKENVDGVECLSLPQEYFETDQNVGSRYKTNHRYHFDHMINDLDNLEEERKEAPDEQAYERFALGDLGKTRIMTVVDDEDLTRVEPLSDLDIHEMVKVLNKSFDPKLGGIVIINQDDFDISAADLDVSCIVKKEDRILALLLITAAENSLVIRKFIVADELSRVSIAHMLKCSYNGMLEKYASSDELLVQKNGENSELLINALQIRAREE